MNPKYTFETFVIAPSNIDAFNIALSVAERPRELYNPLWICSWTGMGKTHLLHAIGHRALEMHPHIRVKYLLAGEVMRAEKEDRLKEVGILLVDDVHLLKDGTNIINFFRILNRLLSENVQVIITCKGSPEGLKVFVSDMFRNGLVTYINPPDKETMIAVLNKICETEGFVSNKEMLKAFIEKALKITPDLQVIENAFHRYLLYQRILGKAPSLDMVEWIISSVD